jgi:hypothetical protein
MPFPFPFVTFDCRRNSFVLKQLCRSAPHPVLCFPVRLRGSVARTRNDLVASGQNLED